MDRRMAPQALQILGVVGHYELHNAVAETLAKALGRVVYKCMVEGFVLAAQGDLHQDSTSPLVTGPLQAACLEAIFT
eukprot:203364-Prorocentrum_minimum.AAC.1